jgi:aminotransferase EvaB
MTVEYSYLREQFGIDSDEVKVSYIDLPKSFDTERTLTAIHALAKRGDFTLGSAVREFEERFAGLCGTRHAIGVNSGTDALFLALRALGVGAGDEVITAANTFIATVGAIVQTGARPVLVDCGADYNIDVSQVEAAITPKTKALLPVHLTGKPADMAAILEIAEQHDLGIVEDAAQAVEADISGQRTGSFGDLAGFSLHPLKNLNVWGDGGIITTNSDSLSAELRLLRNHGLKDRDTVVQFGYNSRLDTLQAIVANELFPDLNNITEARIRNAGRYDEGLAGIPQITVPERSAGIRQVYHTYIVLAEQRGALLQHLQDSGVEAKVHYPVALHLQPAFAPLGYKSGDFPVAEAQARAVITLPVHQHLTLDQIDYVTDAVRAFYA